MHADEGERGGGHQRQRGQGEVLGQVQPAEEDAGYGRPDQEAGLHAKREPAHRPAHPVDGNRVGQGGHQGGLRGARGYASDAL